MFKDKLYFDNNATTPLREAAEIAMKGAMGPPANASSVHEFGRNARMLIEKARCSVAKLAGCFPHEVVFTSGGTESNNIILHHFDNVITSAIEHDSILREDPHFKKIGVNSEGQIELEFFQDIVESIDESKKPQTIVSVMAANNETGVIQPIEEIARIASAAGISLHSDIVQTFGKNEFNFSESGVTYASLSAHKIGGPTGVGAIIIRNGSKLNGLFQGGGQERGRRAGTENLIGIVGFGAAAQDAANDIKHFKKMKNWRNSFEKNIMKAYTSTRIFSSNVPRLANTSCISVGAKPAETMVMAFDLAGVAVSAGAACSSGKVKSSHVLEAMGAGADAGRAVRISGGWMTTKRDFEILEEIFDTVYKKLQY